MTTMRTRFLQVHFRIHLARFQALLLLQRHSGSDQFVAFTIASMDGFRCDGKDRECLPLTKQFPQTLSSIALINHLVCRVKQKQVV